MRGQQAQRCHHQPVSLTAVLFLFFSTEVAESEFRTQPEATAASASKSVDTTPSCTRVDAHFSRAHITVHNSHIDPHFSNVVTSKLAHGKRNQCRAFLQHHSHLVVMSLF